MNLRLCFVDRLLVWNHDVKLLAAHTVGWHACALAVEAIGLDLPLLHRVELHFGEVSNFVVAKAGLESALDSIE